MISPQRSEREEVDQLLLNARLRDEMEPFLDESVDVVNVREMPTPKENEYLASMLAWERAPVLPIADWFQPRLVLPAPYQLTERQLHEILWTIIRRLYEKRIVLDFTDHLSDFQLYCTIARDILPSPEKKIERSPTYLHWHCLDPTLEPDVWLRYYASDEEREAWAEENDEPLPPSEELPFAQKCPDGASSTKRYRQKRDCFGKLFDLVLTLHRIDFECPCVIELRRQLHRTERR